MASLLKIEGWAKSMPKNSRMRALLTPMTFWKREPPQKVARRSRPRRGISHALVLEWVNHVDLFRIKGVGEEYSDLLEAAGVDTVPELAQRKAENLYQKLAEVNEAKKLVRQLPTQAAVADWIEQAKQLPRVVTY